MKTTSSIDLPLVKQEKSQRLNIILATIRVKNKVKFIRSTCTAKRFVSRVVKGSPIVQKQTRSGR